MTSSSAAFCAAIKIRMQSVIALKRIKYAFGMVTPPFAGMIPRPKRGICRKEANMAPIEKALTVLFAVSFLVTLWIEWRNDNGR